MKPGCFLKSIIVLTIIVAAIAYIVQYKSGLFFNKGKKIFTEAFLNDWDVNFDHVKDSRAKSELKDSLKLYLDSLKLDNIPAQKEIGKIMKMVQEAAADSIITNTELKVISNNLRSIENERSEQNRN